MLSPLFSTLCTILRKLTAAFLTRVVTSSHNFVHKAEKTDCRVLSHTTTHHQMMTRVCGTPRDPYPPLNPSPRGEKWCHARVTPQTTNLIQSVTRGCDTTCDHKSPQIRPREENLGCHACVAPHVTTNHHKFVHERRNRGVTRVWHHV